jgi:hypothetical protein
MILADEIRPFVVSLYIMPARRKGSIVSSRITIVSGDIARQLQLQQLVPAVCVEHSMRGSFSTKMI